MLKMYLAITMQHLESSIFILEALLFKEKAGDNTRIEGGLSSRCFVMSNFDT